MGSSSEALKSEENLFPLQNSKMLRKIGKSLASWGKTWICLCFWEAPAMGPLLKK